jgi:predicted MFS family arabinose efflux permease
MATAVGALTGLVFVAVSICVNAVLDDRFHRRRTESTFVILLSILTASVLLLYPAQSRVVVAVEILLIGAVLVHQSRRTWTYVRASGRHEAVISCTIGTAAHVLVCLGAIAGSSRRQPSADERRRHFRANLDLK